MIKYTFCFDDDEIAFEIDETGDTSDESGLSEIPEWLALDRYTCDHCPLPLDSRKTCPAALSLKPIVEGFGQRVAHETVRVIVNLEDLRIEAELTTQNAVRSLAGLQMALSSCPYMRKLRPMARFHLPFGGRERTVFRGVGMYLIAQRLREVRGLLPNWDLEGLQRVYAHVHKVNCRVADRLRAATKKDAAVNSLVILDSFRDAIDLSIEQSLKQLGPWFAMYLEEDEVP